MNTPQNNSRPVVGDRVRVIALQSERRGETGIVTAVSPTRNIYTVSMDIGLSESRWPGFEIRVMEARA